jgi:hypothetical protein
MYNKTSATTLELRPEIIPLFSKNPLRWLKRCRQGLADDRRSRGVSVSSTKDDKLSDNYDEPSDNDDDTLLLVETP